MNSAGATIPRRGWRQRSKCLEGRNDAGLKVDERLIIEFEFARRERVAQIEFQRAAGAQTGVHVRFEKAEDAAAVLLGPVERHVGVLQKEIGRLAIVRRKRDAGAGTDHDLVALDFVRLAHELHDAISQGARLMRSGEPHLQHREFIAAKSRDNVGVAQAHAQTIRHRLQKQIADGVPQSVVDVLELIEIEIKNRELFLDAAHTRTRLRSGARETTPGWASRSARHGAPYKRSAIRPAASPSRP